MPLPQPVVFAVVGDIELHLVGSQNPVVGIHQEADFHFVKGFKAFEIEFQVGIHAVEALPMTIAVVRTTQIGVDDSVVTAA